MDDEADDGVAHIEFARLTSGSASSSNSRLPSLLNKQSSILVACAEYKVKLVPLPSHSAPKPLMLPSRILVCLLINDGVVRNGLGGEPPLL